MLPISFGDNDLAFLEQKHLLDWPPKPVHHGEPLMGFLMFFVWGLDENTRIDAYRLTTVDVFGNTEAFKITTLEAEKWKLTAGPFTLLELFQHAGVRIEHEEEVWQNELEKP